MQSLILSASALAVLVNLFTYLTSTYIVPRWGKTGVQAIVAFFALASALYFTYLQYLPSVKSFLTAAVAIFSLAVSFYEVIWSRIGKNENTENTNG